MILHQVFIVVGVYIFHYLSPFKLCEGRAGNVIKKLSLVKIPRTGSLLRLSARLKGFRKVVGFDLHIALQTLDL